MKWVGLALIVAPIVGLLIWMADDVGWKEVFKAVAVSILVNAGIWGYILLVVWLMK